jgi:hypothetical protein
MGRLSTDRWTSPSTVGSSDWVTTPEDKQADSGITDPEGPECEGKETEMSTAYTPTNGPKQYTGLLAAAAAACIVAMVAVVAIAGFAFGRHSAPHSAAPAPAHTAAIIPVVPVTPAPAHTVTPAKPVTPTPAPSAAVATLQKQLGQLNYYEGPVDGLMGPQTTAAITYLQRDAGLPQTRTMNEATQAALANFLVNGNNQMAS